MKKQFVPIKTPTIVSRIIHFNQAMLTLVLDLESSSIMCFYLVLVKRLLGVMVMTNETLKHFPQSICIFLSYWSREK